ncbi:MAG: thioredoxin family protein [Pseudomonadota bacterium]
MDRPLSALSTPSTPQVLVACLCARWCGTCRDYQAVFDALRQQWADRACFRWVDIEDEADTVGSVEVENFPTLLVAQGGDIRFFGPLPPHAQTLRTTVERALNAPLMASSDPAVTALAQRLAGQV